MKAIQLLEQISATARTGARFASFTYTAKGTGETARHRLALGVDIERAYRRDLRVLNGKRPHLDGIALVACDELIASLRESLEKGIGNNSAYTCAGVYDRFAKGIKAHAETGALHVTGFSLGKTVLAPGVYKDVKSSEKTIAKNALRKLLKSGKIRQFAFAEITGAKMNGKTLEIE